MNTESPTARTPISAKLRRLRREKKQTQVELADAVGVKRSTIANIEAGNDLPGRETLVAIANHFDVSVDWLASPDDRLTAAVDATAKTREEVMVLQTFRRLPPEEQAPLLDFLMRRTGQSS